MQNNFLSPVAPVLELSPKQYSSRQPLHYQHWRHEATSCQAAGKQQGSKASQRICRSSRGLERCWGSAPVLRALICSRNHPLQGDKLSSQWSSYRWQDKRVGWPKILLVKSEEGRWDVCQRMWRLSDFKSRLPQALWRPTVLVCIDSLI